MKKVYTIGIMLSFVVVFLGAGALADNENVTVSWVVPADTSFSLAFAGAETEIDFDDNVDGTDFTHAAPDSQASGTPMLTLTNNGNTPVDVKMAFDSVFDDDGIAFFNASIDNIDNSSLFFWEGQAMGGTDNATNNQTVKEDLAIGANLQIWIWSTGRSVEQSEVDTDTETLAITTIDS